MGWGLVEAGCHVAQASLRLTVQPTPAFNSWFSFLHLPNAAIICVHHHIQLLKVHVVARSRGRKDRVE